MWKTLECARENIIPQLSKTIKPVKLMVVGSPSITQPAKAANITSFQKDLAVVGWQSIDKTLKYDTCAPFTILRDLL